MPGTGKSAFCKALGNEVGRPTLVLDIGASMGSLVGMTEERTRQALRIADAMAPCIVFVDEIEKGLSGVQASGQTDSGVSARMFGTLLSWLNDHESDVFFVCTANDVSKLPPEFTRAERIRRDLLPRPARVAGEGADLAAVPGEVRARILRSDGPATGTSPAPRSGPAAGWRRCWTSRSMRRRRTSCRWP